jgi:hypothetical protein
MAGAKKPRSRPVLRAGEVWNGKREEFVPHAHLIRIADREARLRAIMVLGEVRVPYIGLPDFNWLVVNEHIDALRREGIPYEALS